MKQRISKMAVFGRVVSLKGLLKGIPSLIKCIQLFIVGFKIFPSDWRTYEPPSEFEITCYKKFKTPSYKGFKDTLIDTKDIILQQDFYINSAGSRLTEDILLKVMYLSKCSFTHIDTNVIRVLGSFDGICSASYLIGYVIDSYGSPGYSHLNVRRGCY